MKLAHSKDRLSSQRRGIASLEFVMGLPFLLALGATIISIGIAGIHKTSSTMQVRHDVWAQRTNPPSETRSKPLFIFASPDSGAIEDEHASDFEVYSWLGGSLTAKSKAAVLGGVWDHTEITEFTEYPNIPHFVTILRAVGAPEKFVNLANKILALLSFDSLPNQDEIDEAGEGVAGAEEAVEEERRKIAEKIAELKAELAELREELEELQRQRDEKTEQIRDLEDEYDELVRQGASPAQLQAKLAQIQQARAERDEIDRLIRLKEAEIRAKEKEIRDWEAARDDAEAQGADIPNG